MEMRQRDALAAVVLLAIGTGYAILTYQLPVRTLKNSTQPSFFPWIIVVCLLILAGALLVQSFQRRSADGQDPPAIFSTAVLVWIGVFGAYLIVLPFLGFFVANIFVFAALMLLYGERSPIKIVLGSMITTPVIFFLFREVFQIRLPAGVLAAWIP